MLDITCDNALTTSPFAFILSRIRRQGMTFFRYCHSHGCLSDQEIMVSCPLNLTTIIIETFLIFSPTRLLEKKLSYILRIIKIKITILFTLFYLFLVNFRCFKCKFKGGEKKFKSGLNWLWDWSNVFPRYDFSNKMFFS